MNILLFSFHRITVSAAICLSAVLAPLHARSPQGWLRDSLPEAKATPLALSADTSSVPTATAPASPTAPPKPSAAPPTAQTLAAAAAPSAPDEVSPEITSLVRGVTNSPGAVEPWAKCFLFVKNQLDYEHYYGCKKGALLTLLERKGNDADLAALLVPMLRSAGYQARYGYGVVAFRYANHPQGFHMQDWLGVPKERIAPYNANRGFPATYEDESDESYALHRVWVEVSVNGTWIKLDPAVNRRVRVNPAVDVAAVTGYDRNALKAAAGGTVAGSSIEGIDEGALGSYLKARTTALLAHLEQNHHGTDASDLIGGWKYEPFISADGGEPIFIGTVSTTPEPPQRSDTLPSLLLTTVAFEVRSTASGAPVVASASMPMASLQGRRVSLTFTAADSSGRAQIWLDDTLLAEEASAADGATVKLKVAIDHPHSGSGGTQHDQLSENSYKRGSSYALTYSFNPSDELLRSRQEKLDAYRRAGLSDTSREVVTETLNVMGQTWFRQTELAKRILCARTNCDPVYHHRMGRVSQENGYYIDVDLQFGAMFSLDGNTAQKHQAEDARDYFSSAMEHAVIEQLQGAANPSISTVKLLRLGNQQPGGSGKIFYATQATWGGIQGQLQGYSSSDLNSIQDIVSQGGEALLPQKGNITLNQWTGAGYITRLTSNGVSATQMKISGGLNGGYASKRGKVDPKLLSQLFNAGSGVANTTPYIVGAPLGLDPIDLASGDYLLSATDLEVGAASPRGFSFARQYHGHRRWIDPAGLGYGWTHNWHVRATRRSAYEPALGVGGTPFDVAGALVAAHAALDLSSAPADAQHWTLASLTVHWLTDQLQDNAVGISIGERALQFARRADGIWQPPGGVTMTLAPAGAGWELRERHGNTYRFDAERLTEIEDLWGKKLTIGYDAAGKVAAVTDAYARSMTFTYTGSLLTTVTDSTGRTIGFAFDAHGNLITVTDPEGKADRFSYDADHRIIEVRNHDNEIVATNIYDNVGNLIEQLSQGAANRKWKYYYAPDCSVEEDPQGGRTAYFFDRKKRQIKRQDALGRTTTTVYDGQDRTTQVKTPLGRTTTWEFDRFHNVLSVTDPDNTKTAHIYDAQQRLTTINQPLNRTTIFTYNAQHQPLTVTNGEGDTITNTYNASTGTLASTSDGTATTTYGYNGRDERTSTSFAGGGTETVQRNIFGDPTSVTDARGNTISTTYNNRRQVLTITRPGFLSITHSYDNQRRVGSVTDARGNPTTYAYSPTGKLLATTLPSTGAGTGTITDVYDTRDWRVSTTNPLNQTTTFIYNAAGELIQQKDGLGRPTTFTYDVDGRIKTTKDALNRTVAQEYNGRGQVISTTDQLNKTSTNTIDNGGRREAFTNRRNRTYQFGHDKDNRLLSTITPSGRTTSQTWNDRGLIASITEPSNDNTSITYDARGRVLTRTDAVGTISYTYDDNGNLLTVTENGVTITRTYDVLNRVITYNDGRGHTVAYTYDGNNNLTSLTYELGKTVNYTYDERNRLVAITDWTGRVTTLEHDQADRLVRVNRPNQTRRDTVWDAAGQLASVNDRHAPSGQPVIALRITYDAAGHLKRKLEMPARALAQPLPARTAAYNDDNQLTDVNGLAIAHDTDGNVTSAPAPGGGATLEAYGWNSRNQLVTAPGGLTFSYDAEGLRTSYTQGSGSTTFVNDPHGPLSRVLQRIRPDGTRTFYIYGPVLLYEIEETGNAARHYHYDHLGSTVALSSDAGQVTGRVAYASYGLTFQSSGTLNTPFLWNGAFGVQIDPNGLVHMRARYLHPYLSRFLSEDPLGLAAGPNVYGYAEGNPITNVDPSGHIVETVWDVANIGLGAYSLQDNYRSGNYGAAGLDALGLVVDAAATLLPFVPAGAGAGLKALRGAKTVVDSADNIGDAVTVTKTGGRLGNDSTRRQVAEIAAELESRGWTITGGGGRLPEEYLPGPGGARKGSSYPDITAVKDGKVVRINTIDTLSDGVTPTRREATNADRIRNQTQGDRLLLAPKKQSGFIPPK